MSSHPVTGVHTPAETEAVFFAAVHATRVGSHPFLPSASLRGGLFEDLGIDRCDEVRE